MERKQTAMAWIALALAIFLSSAYFVFASPSQTGTCWRDNFTDTAGIAALSKMNFSTCSLSLNNTPWF